MMIKYIKNLDKVKKEDLEGFFVAWPNKPTKEMHYKILKNSEHIVLAIDEEQNRVVGFVNAITDKVLYAYIPLLEVLPEYQNQGIGKELLKEINDDLKNLYAIDLCCANDLVDYYKNQGFYHLNGMIKRNFHVLKEENESRR